MIYFWTNIEESIGNINCRSSARRTIGKSLHLQAGLLLLFLVFVISFSDTTFRFLQAVEITYCLCFSTQYVFSMQISRLSLALTEMLLGHHLMRNPQCRCAVVEMIENYEFSLMSSINKCIWRCGVLALFPGHHDMMWVMKDYNYPVSPVRTSSALAPVSIDI